MFLYILCFCVVSMGFGMVLFNAHAVFLTFMYRKLCMYVWACLDSDAPDKIKAPFLGTFITALNPVGNSGQPFG